MMSLLRRRHRLDPLEITTAPAPVLGGPHVDVTEGAAQVITTATPLPALQVEGSVSFDLDDQAAAALCELAAVYDDDRPPVDRGTCYHDTHIDYDGRRLGLFFIGAGHTRASLVPCPYLGKAGR